MYFGGKYAQSAILRAAAQRAGVHLYSRSDDVLYADANFLAIHARTGGSKRLSFPQPVDCYEVFENKSYGSKVRELVFEMDFGETKVFCLKGRI